MPPPACPAPFSTLPASGTVLHAGAHETLTVTFTPSHKSVDGDQWQPLCTTGNIVVTTCINVTPAPLTIKANDASKVYGAAVPALTASYSGWVNGDSAASLTHRPALSTTATAASHVGGYLIAAAGASDPDYLITYQTGTLNVTQACLTIKANDASKVYGAVMPALTASYSGWVNGDSTTSLVHQAMLSTLATSASNVGSYPIVASGAVSADYAIRYVSGALTVTPASMVITADNTTKVYGAAVPCSRPVAAASSTEIRPCECRQL